MQLASRFLVVVLVLLTGWAVTNLTQQSDIEDLGYGVPALTDGRIWTLVIGMFLVKDHSVPVPTFSLIAIIMYEHVAAHWRTVVVLLGGQIGGVLVVSASLWTIDVVHDSIDFGMSVGGFALLGAWTAHLPGVWRRRLRLGLSAYFPGMLVLHGLIYDYTHPAGWLLGIWMGALLRPPASARDDTPFRRSELPALVLTCSVAAAVGIVLGK